MLLVDEFDFRRVVPATVETNVEVAGANCIRGLQALVAVADAAGR